MFTFIGNESGNETAVILTETHLSIWQKNTFGCDLKEVGHLKKTLPLRTLSCAGKTAFIISRQAPVMI